MGISIETEVITIGSDTYTKDPASGGWQVSQESPTPYGDVANLSGFDSNLMETVETAAPREAVLEGDPVYYLQGTIPGEVMTTWLDDPGVGAGDTQVEIWAGAKDYLVRQIRMDMELYLSGDKETPEAGRLKAVTTIRISKYGEPVEIKAPEDARPLVSTEDQHGDDPESASLIEHGWVINGAIQTPWDRDFFVFEAEASNTYQITLERETLPEVEITLYAPEGDLTKLDRDDSGDDPWTRIQWTAEETGRHHLEIQGREDSVGRYSLIVNMAP